MVGRSPVVLATLAFVLLVGCAPNVVNLGSPTVLRSGCTSGSVERVSTIHAGGGNDTIYGSGRLFGEADRDTVFAGLANDQINGGFDADILMGRAGADRFSYDDVRDSASDAWGRWSADAGDTIMDFSPADGDEIDLRGLSGARSGGPAAHRWNGGEARPWSVWARPLYTDTVVFVETDGDTRADMAIRLIGQVALTPNDFCGVAAP